MRIEFVEFILSKVFWVDLFHERKKEFSSRLGFYCLNNNIGFTMGLSSNMLKEATGNLEENFNKYKDFEMVHHKREIFI